VNDQHASIVRTDFGGETMQVQHETSAVAVAAAEEAAIKARYILAMKNPRDWSGVEVRLLKECERPGFADAAIYRKPVGKKKNERTGEWEQQYTEGLSVRFAEAALRHMTNTYTSAKSIYDNPEKQIVRVTVMDLESNTTHEYDADIAKTVERRELKRGQRPLSTRVNSYGDTVYIVPGSDDDVLNKKNSHVSKALRNGAMKLLPGDIQDACEAACRATQARRDKADPDAAKKALFTAFSAYGIMPEDLKQYLGTTADVLQPAELSKLRAIYSAIRDSETTWAQVVDSKDPHPEDAKAVGNAKQVNDLLKKHQEKAAAPKNGPKPAEATTSSAPAAQTQEAAKPAPTFSEADQVELFKQAFAAATNGDEFAAANRDFEAIKSQLSAANQLVLIEAGSAAIARLKGK
jgi:hypothetical protein